MTALMEIGGKPAHKLDGTPNDARRNPKRIEVPLDLGAGTFRVVVIGTVNNRNQRFEVCLVQALDPGLPLYSHRDMQNLREAIYAGLETHGYEGWGLTESMVDLLP